MSFNNQNDKDMVERLKNLNNFFNRNQKRGRLNRPWYKCDLIFSKPRPNGKLQFSISFDNKKHYIGTCEQHERQAVEQYFRCVKRQFHYKPFEFVKIMMRNKFKNGVDDKLKTNTCIICGKKFLAERSNRLTCGDCYNKFNSAERTVLAQMKKGIITQEQVQKVAELRNSSAEDVCAMTGIKSSLYVYAIRKLLKEGVLEAQEIVSEKVETSVSTHHVLMDLLMNYFDIRKNMICPVCGGKLVIRPNLKRADSHSGEMFIGCSNYKYNNKKDTCKYMRPIDELDGLIFKDDIVYYLSNYPETRVPNKNWNILLKLMDSYLGD